MIVWIKAAERCRKLHHTIKDNKFLVHFLEPRSLFFLKDVNGALKRAGCMILLEYTGFH